MPCFTTPLHTPPLSMTRNPEQLQAFTCTLDKLLLQLPCPLKMLRWSLCMYDHCNQCAEPPQHNRRLRDLCQSNFAA